MKNPLKKNMLQIEFLSERYIPRKKKKRTHFQTYLGMDFTDTQTINVYILSISRYLVFKLISFEEKPNFSSFSYLERCALLFVLPNTFPVYQLTSDTKLYSPSQLKLSGAFYIVAILVMGCCFGFFKIFVFLTKTESFLFI